jgi:hypothetical protein
MQSEYQGFAVKPLHPRMATRDRYVEGEVRTDDRAGLILDRDQTQSRELTVTLPANLGGASLHELKRTRSEREALSPEFPGRSGGDSETKTWLDSRRRGRLLWECGRGK